MSQVNGFLHGDVAPVRNLDGARDAADGEEWHVILIVDLHGVLQGKPKCTFWVTYNSKKIYIYLKSTMNRLTL